jgi:N-acetylglutamate synthase
MGLEVRTFRAEDHAQAWSLWQSMEGVGLSEADSFENICRFLERT